MFFRKYMLIIFYLLSLKICLADTWTEDFESNPSTAYGDASVTISGRIWNKEQAGNFSLGNFVAGSYGFTINNDKAGAHITTPALNTIGTVSFKYAFWNGSNSNIFVLQKSTNGTDFTSLDTHILGASAYENYIDYSYTIDDASSTVYIRILSDDQNAHLFIDDFTVTPFGTISGSSYYSSITATEGQALKSQLKPLISTNTNTNYGGARAAMYSNIDNINNTVTCVYTGLEVSHNYGNTSAPTDINCEHTYAISWIEDYDSQNEELRAKADVHHLFPTESGVNSSRGNLSFDDVN